jgi:hypothetical protein
MREADQLIDRRDRVSREIYARRLAFNDTVANAKTVEQLVIVPTTKGSVYPDLEKRPYYELEQELRKLGFRIEYDDLLDDPVTRARDEMHIILSEYVDKADELQGPISSKNPSKVELDKFLQQRKLISLLLAEQTDFDRTFETYAFSFKPDCTIPKTLETALGNRPDIVRAIIDAHYDSSDISETMMKHLEKAKVIQKQIMAYK